MDKISTYMEEVFFNIVIKYKHAVAAGSLLSLNKSYKVTILKLASAEMDAYLNRFFLLLNNGGRVSSKAIHTLIDLYPITDVNMQVKISFLLRKTTKHTGLIPLSVIDKFIKNLKSCSNENSLVNLLWGLLHIQKKGYKLGKEAKDFLMMIFHSKNYSTSTRVVTVLILYIYSKNNPLFFAKRKKEFHEEIGVYKAAKTLYYMNKG